MSSADCEPQGTGWGILDDLPGDPMIWVLIFSELAAFGLFLGTFTVARAIHPAVFAAGQAALDPGPPRFNTILLGTSGWGGIEHYCAGDERLGRGPGYEGRAGQREAGDTILAAHSHGAWWPVRGGQ